MKTKPILRPERLRHVPRQFSWIDQRLVRDRHIQGRSHEALALYLFLCIVADAEGTSYYSDSTVGKILTFSSTRLREARAELIAAGLIAHQSPFYQVLSLDPQPAALLTSAPSPRAGEVLSAADILRAIMEVPK